MQYYQIYGLCVESDYDLKIAYRYQTKPSELVDIIIVNKKIDEGNISKEEAELSQKYSRFVHFREDWACVRYPYQAIFVIENGKQINYQLYENYDQKYIEQIILCYCIPVLLLQREMLVIHGSCIKYNEKALIISGESGVGKSSLADEILGRGNQLISDDIVAVDSIEHDMYVYPSFPMRKLCVDVVERIGLDKATLLPIPKEDKEKYGLILKEEYCKEQTEPGAMVIIKAGDVVEPVLEEVKGSVKLKYLTENFFRTDVYEQIGLSREGFMKAIQLSNLMPIYILTRPKAKMTVKEQADLIEKIL